MSFGNCFDGKTVLITGHTGFKGSWLVSWLLLLGARVVGVALPPYSSPSHFDTLGLTNSIEDHRIDICDYGSIEKLICKTQPDFVFHLAAQALVQTAYSDPLKTWKTNLIGTLNILEALRKLDKFCVSVMITSDKCYDNVEWVWGYRETDTLGGSCPYSASKAAAELSIRSHVKSYFSSDKNSVLIASARAGNVIGGGDWSQNRLIPDCIRAWSTGEIVELRHPHSTRPWQHVLEPLSGYLTLAQALVKRPSLHGESFNFGPLSQHNFSVMQLVEEMAHHWNQVRWLDCSQSYLGPQESSLLKLNCDKAVNYLQWEAVLDFPSTVKLTADWYRSYYNNQSNILDLTNSQIMLYVATAKAKSASWVL